MQRGPNTLAHHGETDKDRRRHERPHDLEPVIAVRVIGALLVRGGAIFPDDPAETNLRRRKSDAANHDRDHELAIDARSVFRNCLGKPPMLADKHTDRAQRYDPDGYSESAS